jgi:hypothetical protein
MRSTQSVDRDSRDGGGALFALLYRRCLYIAI